VKSYPITFKPFGAKAILIEWPNKVTEEILVDIINFRTLLETKLTSDFEFIPAYNSLTILTRSDDFVFHTFSEELKELYQTARATLTTKRICWEVPVCYDADFGIDLKEVAGHLNMTIEGLIEIHSSYEYTLYGIGFLPGFMYLGGIPWMEHYW